MACALVPGEAAAALPQERLSALNKELGELVPAMETLAQLQAQSAPVPVTSPHTVPRLRRRA